MNTTGQMGVAVGYAAVLCKKYSAMPREIYKKHIEELVTLTRRGRPKDGLRGEHKRGYTKAGSSAATSVVKAGEPLKRTAGGYDMSDLPEALRSAVRVVPARGEMKQPGGSYRVKVSQSVTAYLAVHERGSYVPPQPWKKTDLAIAWSKGKDTVYRQDFPAGEIKVPAHTGKNENGQYGLPSLLLLVPADAAKADDLKVTVVE